MAAETAAHYRALLAEGVPDSLARELARDYQRARLAWVANSTGLRKVIAEAIRDADALRFGDSFRGQ